MKSIVNRHKNWSDEDIQIMLDMLGDAMISSIATRLGRTVEGVIRKLEKLGLYDMAYETGGFRTYEFASFLSVDPTTIIRWIKEENFPARQLYKRGANDATNRYHYIYPDNFWRWAKKNTHLLNFARIQRDMILPEPAWLEGQILHDKKHKAIKSQALWTSKEDSLIWTLFYEDGMTQQDIGDRVGRTRSGVQRRLSVLRKKNNKREPVGL